MSKTLYVAAVLALGASPALANNVTYSSQEGVNSLYLQLQGVGNSVGAEAPAGASVNQNTGTWQSEKSKGFGNTTMNGRPVTDLRYFAYTNVTWAQTATSTYPTDYSAAKQVGDNNRVNAIQHGNRNTLNFSQGSDSVFEETISRAAIDSDRVLDFKHGQADDISLGRDLGAEAEYNREFGFTQTFSRGAVTTATGNLLDVDQYGEDNGAVINQLGDYNVADLYQSGANNQFDVMQAGDSSYLEANQIGVGNGMLVRQYSTNTATLNQFGNDNFFEVYQGDVNGASAHASTVDVTTNGNENTIHITQNGDYGGNSIVVTQDGNGNEVFSTQSGSGSGITLLQDGNNNMFNAVQTSTMRQVQVAMYGTGGNVYLTQR